MKKLVNKKGWESPMDDVQVFKPAELPKNEVVLGVYGSVEWTYADFLRRRHLAGLRTLEKTSTWLIPADFNLAEWVVSTDFKSYTFFEAHQVVIPTETGYLQIQASKAKIDVNAVGDPEFCEKWMSYFEGKFKKAENLIQWVYNARGDTIAVPLNYRKGLNSAYPWLHKPMISYIDDYLNSDACVLILIGPPGTGKTTFIKNLIHRSKGDAKVAYDEKVLSGDDFFAGFIDGECNILVMEDADTFLQSRQDGNSMMHKFLNVSDGLISALGKKMIFSTNLPNITDIDSALLRTGRCFDTVQFRPLSRTEAQAVLEEAGDERELPDGNNLTLAEIFSSQPSANAPKRRMGF